MINNLQDIRITPQALVDSNVVNSLDEFYAKYIANSTILFKEKPLAVDLGDYNVWYEQYLTNNLTKQDYDAAYVENIINGEDLVARSKLLLAHLAFENVPEPIEITKNTYNISSILYTITDLENQKVDHNSGLTIFNAAHTTKTIPFIQYNDDQGHSYYLVFSKYEITTVPLYNMIIPRSTQNHKPNTIYFTAYVDIGDKPPTLKSYVRCYLSLDTGKMHISITESGLLSAEQIAAYAAESLNLKLSMDPENRYHGSFNLNHLAFEETSFYYMLLNDPALTAYIYLDESLVSRGDKKWLIYRYHRLDNPKSTVSFSFGIEKDEKDVVVAKRSALAPALYQTYLRVNVIRADSIEEYEDFMKIISMIMAYYKLRRADTIDYINTKIPNSISNETPAVYFLNQIEGVDNNDEAGQKVSTKIKSLTKSNPDLFISGYAKECQCPLQPISIPDSHKESWKQMTVTDKNGEVHNRAVVEFPPDSGNLYTCPDDNNPYFTPKKNNLANNTKFTHLPCCAKTYNKGDYSQRNFVPEEDEEKEEELEEVNGWKVYRMQTMKKAKPGQYGSLHPDIQELLQPDSGKEFVRYGVQSSRSSFTRGISSSR